MSAITVMRQLICRRLQWSWRCACLQRSSCSFRWLWVWLSFCKNNARQVAKVAPCNCHHVRSHKPSQGKIHKLAWEMSSIEASAFNEQNKWSLCLPVRCQAVTGFVGSTHKTPLIAHINACRQVGVTLQHTGRRDYRLASASTPDTWERS